MEISADRDFEQDFRESSLLTHLCFDFLAHAQHILIVLNLSLLSLLHSPLTRLIIEIGNSNKIIY